MRKRTGPICLTLNWLATSAGLAGCVSTPSGATVAVMPAPNKPFEVFAQDQAVCSQYASQQVSGVANQANSYAFGTAVVGTILGAGLGAAVGGGPGAAVSAASGALGGSSLSAHDGRTALTLPIRRLAVNN
jgi:hypothetical protein